MSLLNVVLASCTWKIEKEGENVAISVTDEEEEKYISESHGFKPWSTFSIGEYATPMPPLLPRNKEPLIVT